MPFSAPLCDHTISESSSHIIVMPSTATTIEDNTTDQAEAAAEDSSSTTDHVPHYPWFSQHVQTSLIKRSFTPLYFTVGLVEEMAELEAELRSWRRHQHNRDEAGTGVDILHGSLTLVIYAM